MHCLRTRPSDTLCCVQPTPQVAPGLFYKAQRAMNGLSLQHTLAYTARAAAQKNKAPVGMSSATKGKSGAKAVDSCCVKLRYQTTW
jgi:hypothetical protein